VAANFTPVRRNGYRVGVPQDGRYREVLNTDSAYYGGSNAGNGPGLTTEPRAWMSHPISLVLTLPPLGAVFLVREP
jgi:1,4-alpha-glucan branching enzyme